jgi:transmembrane sensor
MLRRAAAVALAACLAFAFVPEALLRIQADLVTAAAEMANIRLADGSRVHLAPESAVSVVYLGDRREVRLIKGRAFFEVTPDPARPFTVAAGTTTATVLGTAFDVRLEPAGARIAVREGRVRVDNADTAPPTHAVLSTGNWVRMTRNGGTQQGSMPADEVATWLGGELVARDRPAGDVADALRPYFKGMILVQSSRFAERRVSGIYSLKDPVATLAGLAESHGAVMRQVSPWLLVVTDW